MLNTLISPMFRHFSRTIRHGLVARRFGLLSVAFPLGLRVIPELLAGPWPLGFDTLLSYAPFVKDVESRGFWPALSGIVGSHIAPLMFIFLGLAAVPSRAPPFVVTKTVAPLLYGLLGFSIFFLAHRGLEWDRGKSLLLVIVTTLYFVPLRFSWDLYKNTLGYAFFIFAFSYIRKSPRGKSPILFASFAVLCILSSELTTVLLGATAALSFLWDLGRERRWNLPQLYVALVSASGIFFYSPLLFQVPIASAPLAPPPIQHSFLYNYVGVTEDVYSFATLWDLYVTVFLLTSIVFGPMLLFIAFGFLFDKGLMCWTVSLAVGSFSILVVPFAGIPLWHRWLFMMTFPMMIFTVRGLVRFKGRVTEAFLVLLVLLSAAFMILPPENALIYYSNPYTLSYIPSTMMQNTVPLPVSPDIVNALQWLNGMQFANPVLVAPSSFVGWAKLYSTIPGVYGFSDPAQVNDGNFLAYNHVFLLYWVVGKGWFKPSLMPAGMVEIHHSGDIAIYERSRSS